MIAKDFDDMNILKDFIPFSHLLWLCSSNEYIFCYKKDILILQKVFWGISILEHDRSIVEHDRLTVEHDRLIVEHDCPKTDMWAAIVSQTTNDQHGAIVQFLKCWSCISFSSRWSFKPWILPLWTHSWLL